MFGAARVHMKIPNQSCLPRCLLVFCLRQHTHILTFVISLYGVKKLQVSLLIQPKHLKVNLCGESPALVFWKGLNLLCSQFWLQPISEIKYCSHKGILPHRKNTQWGGTKWRIFHLCLGHFVTSRLQLVKSCFGCKWSSLTGRQRSRYRGLLEFDPACC